MEDRKRDFHHPYEPYDVQQELMKTVYDCIANGKIGIFESPTGTGKSLSLICSSLTWLRDAQEETLQGLAIVDDGKDEPGWVVDHTQSEMIRSIGERNLRYEAHLAKIRVKELRQRKTYVNGDPMSKRAKADKDEVTDQINDDKRFELDDYDSDDAAILTKIKAPCPPHQGLSSTSLQLMEKLGLLYKPLNGEDDFLPTDAIKIYFCSRTHSQLTQFVREVRRVDLPKPSWTVTQGAIEDNPNEPHVVIKHVPLGSRRNLCINPNVTKLGNTSAINERCLELQQPSIPKDHKCPFIPNKDNGMLIDNLRDHTFADIRDIEDLRVLGKSIGICPYYASRAIIKPSEIVTMPYPLLLQTSAREALDISLKGHVVIIDEAHNLMDTISNIYSLGVSQAQLQRCRSQLRIYLQNFRNRLKGKNRVYIAQLVRLIDSISGYLETAVTNNMWSEGIVMASDLLAGKGVDQINLYKLMQYLQESKLARKVEGYAVHLEEQDLRKNPNSGVEAPTSTMPVLTHVQSFLQTLTNPAAEGRFFYEKDEENNLFLKYMQLDPTHHFRGIVEDARAVILAGGTMSPVAIEYLVWN